MIALSKDRIAFGTSLAIGCAVVATGCGRADKPPPPLSMGAPEGIREYPRARWRLASPTELARTVLYVSQIVVMHRISLPTALDLRPLGWSPDSAVTRSPADALKRAQDLARRAQKDPSSFAELARESDDVTTRDRGGSLGAMEAVRLPAEFLDALAALPPGGVSGVISTPMGYHIILKRVPPPREDVAGQRIVIRYTTTFGYEPSSRSRADALALSRRIIEEAKNGADFGELIKKYSEGIDRGRGGDMGIATTVEPGIHSRVIEALSMVNPGDVLPEPVETSWGFEIAKRVPVVPHTEFAARVVRLSFDPSQPSSEKEAHDQALALAEAARRGPRAIATAASVERIRWSDGKGDPELTSIVEGLAIGHSTEDPVRLGDAFAMIEREEPDSFASPPQPKFELPEPTWVDIGSLIERNDSQLLARATGELRKLVPAMHLSSVESRELGSTLDRLHSALLSSATRRDRSAAYVREVTSLKGRISEASYARIITVVQDLLANRLINPPAPAGG